MKFVNHFSMQFLILTLKIINQFSYLLIYLHTYSRTYIHKQLCYVFVACSVKLDQQQRTAKQEPDRSWNDRQRSESANPSVHYRDVRLSENVAEDLSRPLSSSYPHYHRPLAHTGISPVSARLPEEVTTPTKLPPPAHSHHRRSDAAADHILADGSMRHRSPARNMPSPRAHAVCEHLPPTDVTPREDLPWLMRRTVPPPLPYLPPTPCTITATSGSVPKFSATSSGPPPLIHEPVKGVSGAGSIVLGTPLSPEQRRRHFELPPAVGMLYKTGNDPNVLRSGFAGPPPIAQPPPPPPAPQDGQFPIIARQSGVPWPQSHVQQSVIRATGDASMVTSSHDLLYGDMITARQMDRSHVSGLTDPGADRRRISPRGAGSYGQQAWPHAPRGGRNEPTGPQFLDDVHRADILSSMMPWPVRPQANMTRYSVCGEPSRQCYTPPLPIHKAFVGRDPVPAGLPSGDRFVRRDNANAPVPGRFPDTSCGDAKISPRFKDTAENIAEWRRTEVLRSPVADTHKLPSSGGHRPSNQGSIQASAVTTTSDQLTAASLIDAIIIDQINQDPAPVSVKPCGHSPGRAPAAAASVSILDRLRTNDTSTNSQSAESVLAPVLCSPTAGDKLQPSLKPSPSVVDHSGGKDLTLGEHIQSIIMQDFEHKDGNDAGNAAFDTATNIV